MISLRAVVSNQRGVLSFSLEKTVQDLSALMLLDNSDCIALMNVLLR